MWRKNNPDRLRAYRKEHQTRNPEATKAKTHRHKLAKYKLTEENLVYLLDRQGRTCAICCRPFGPGLMTMNIDHDHNTGAVRGLLCSACNKGLGYFGDLDFRLLRAIDYLRGKDPIIEALIPLATLVVRGR